MITVLLLRHADIDLPPASDNPPLNAAGMERANELVRVAGTAGIAAAFTSSRVRTKQTVQPLAARLGIEPREVSPPDVFAEEILSGTVGDVVLVAGHSNTIPEMIAALGAPPLSSTIGEREFDNLFVVTVAGSGTANVLGLKYGRSSA
jgi:phosphohistidine phosphatase SixA